MGFTFLIEQASEIPTSGLYLLDSQLVDGEITNGCKCQVTGDVDCEIVPIRKLSNHTIAPDIKELIKHFALNLRQHANDPKNHETAS
jgi:hypothetical protein